MTTNKPLFRFNTQVTESDPTGYYITRWDEALPVTVIAHNRDEAFKKARASRLATVLHTIEIAEWIEEKLP